VAYLWERAD
jgi:hypothetical protein